MGIAPTHGCDQEDGCPSPSSTGCSMSTEPDAATEAAKSEPATEPAKPDAASEPAKPEAATEPAKSSVEGQQAKRSSGPAEVNANSVRKARCLLARYNIDWRSVDLATLMPLPTARTKSGYVGSYPARGRRWQAQLLHRTLGAYSSAWEAGCAVTRALVRLSRVDCGPDSFDTDPYSSPLLLSVFAHDNLSLRRSYSHEFSVPTGFGLPYAAAFAAEASSPLQQEAAQRGHLSIIDRHMAHPGNCGAQPQALSAVGAPATAWYSPSQLTTEFSAGRQLDSSPIHSSLFSGQQMPGMPMPGGLLQDAQAQRQQREPPLPMVGHQMPMPNGVAAAPKAYDMARCAAQSAYQAELADLPPLPWQGVASYYSPQHHRQFSNGTHECRGSGLPSYSPELSETWSQQSMPQPPRQQSMPQQPMAQQPMAQQWMSPQSMPLQPMPHQPMPPNLSMPPQLMTVQSMPQQPMQHQPMSTPTTPQQQSIPTKPMPPQSMPHHQPSMAMHSMPPQTAPPLPMHHMAPPTRMQQQSILPSMHLSVAGRMQHRTTATISHSTSSGCCSTVNYGSNERAVPQGPGCCVEPSANWAEVPHAAQVFV